MRIKRRIAHSAANVLSVAMRAGGRPFYRYMLDSLWERQPFFDPSTAQEPLEIELFYRGYVDPDPGDSALVERIFAAYRKAKAAQRAADRSLRAPALAGMIREHLGLSVHPRSIERALSRRAKRGRHAEPS